MTPTQKLNLLKGAFEDIFNQHLQCASVVISTHDYEAQLDRAVNCSRRFVIFELPIGSRGFDAFDLSVPEAGGHGRVAGYEHRVVSSLARISPGSNALEAVISRGSDVRRHLEVMKNRADIGFVCSIPKIVWHPKELAFAVEAFACGASSKKPRK